LLGDFSILYRIATPPGASPAANGEPFTCVKTPLLALMA
jgi:hypothetical protein